ncbi:ROK family protein [Pseudanabaena sp. PCC 6802]|uniref:ROK family protein n=1 Tax=Pseudanabaena sp. PCC 6802 TaxID=118173 RepID=UPI00034BA6B0|nr:ROK family protein [Pseudanabaena sp. PCC 6802]
MTASSTSKLTLAVDVGGSGIKMLILDEQGQPQTERVRIDTPQPATPDRVIPAIAQLASTVGAFDRVAVGFPSVVQHGITRGAINLSPVWDGFDLGNALGRALGKPIRIANDADVQGLGAIAGSGVELVITLGTGFGSSLFVDGKLLPNLQLGQHPFSDDKTYEEHLGNAAFEKYGQKTWNRRLSKAIATLSKLFNYEYLYIGGGNAKKIELELPVNVKVISNKLGLLGGIALWRD